MRHMTYMMGKMGLQYKILAAEINVPVEYYLQLYHFDKVYFFSASTYFYNGIVYPKTNFVCLLPVLFQNAMEFGVSAETRKWMESILNIRFFN